MAVPSYTTDLVDIDLCEAAGKTWAEPTAVGWTLGAAPALDTENYIQGSSAISKAFNATGVGGMMVNNTAAITLPTDGAFLGWFYWASPSTLETDANGGLRMMIGSSLAAFNSWDVGGKTSYVYGGWINYAVNTTVAYDDTVSTGLGNSQYVGMSFWNTNAITKGSPGLCDAFRYGRCEARMSGGSLADGYATFAGFAAVNDAGTARWGLIQSVNGSYLVKGLVVFGYLQAVTFNDSNKAIFIQNTNKVTSNFNTFEVRQTGSSITLASITITSLGTVSKGRWLTTDNATVSLTSCVFTDMGVFDFKSNSTITSSTFRRCGNILQSGATFTGCLIDSSSSPTGMTVSDISKITNTTFLSDGTGYAIEGFSSDADYSLVGLTFTSFASSDGTTGNEAIHVLATSGIVNLNVSGGGNTPSIHSAGATVNVVLNAVTVSVTVKDVNGANIQNARVLMLADAGGPMPSNATVTIARTGSTATVSHATHAMATNDKVQIKGANQQEYNGVYSITKINANAYNYTLSGTPVTAATGTIKATYAPISDLTSSSGITSTSRVFTSNQPITGRVRKSTSSPYYKTSNFTGTIKSASGLEVSVLLISDE